MNKSKFLKKSLAAVLAVLLIAAMIPLSAAAAYDAPITRFTVNGEEVASNGKALSATVKDTTNVVLGAVCPEGTALQYKKKDGTAVGFISNNNGWTATIADLNDCKSTGENTYEIPVIASTTVEQDDQPTEVEYTLTITYSPDASSGDNEVKTVKKVSGKITENMTAYDIDNVNNKITITVPFGTTAAAPDDSCFTYANDVAAKVFTANGSGITTDGKLVVTAANGNTRQYTVVTVWESPFKSLSVEGQTADAKFNLDGTATTGQGLTIDVKMPYGVVVGTEKVTLTYELADGFKGVKTTVNGGAQPAEIVSGKTKVDITGTAGSEVITLTVVPKSGSNGTVTVKLDIPAKNPEGLLKSIKVSGNGKTSNTIDVDKDTRTIDVEMPANWDFANASEGKAATVSVVASENAEVVAVESNVKVATADGTTTDDLTPIDVSGKRFTIRVKSEDGNTTNEYTINLTKAAAAENKLNNFTLKGEIDGEKIERSAVWNGETGTVTVPYAFLKSGNQGTVNVYATSSVGSHIALPATPDTAIEFGKTYTAMSTNVPTIDATHTENKIQYVVKNADNGTATYTIIIKTEAPRTQKSFISGTLVGTNDYNQITANNTYAMSAPTKIKEKTSGEMVNAIKVTVPYSYNDEDPYFSALELSPGAVAYMYRRNGGSNQSYDKVAVLDKDVLGSQTAMKPIDMVDTGKANFLSAYDKTANTLDVSNIGAVAMFVVSEKYAALAADSIPGANWSTTDMAKYGEVYYLYGEQAPAEKGNTMTSLASTLDTNVTASVNNSTQTINITVPDSYNNASYTENTTAEFSLNFVLSKMAGISVGANKLVSDLGNKDTTGRSMFCIVDGALNLVTGNVGSKSVTPVGAKLNVTAEDGTVRAYDVKVKVNDPEKGYALTGVEATCGANKGTGRISGTTVTLTMPFGTKLFPAKVKLTASKMATIGVYDGTDYDTLFDPDATFDLNNDIKVQVTAEDGEHSQIYTIKTTLGERFTDVPANAWFAPYVDEAYDREIIEGQGNGIFNPNGNITRQDFALMTVRMLGKEDEAKAMENDPIAFSDADRIADYAKGAVAYCATNKILNGYDTGKFEPTLTITREEAAKILAVAKGLEVTGTPDFADNSRISGWAQPYVAAVQAAGIFKGDEANRFNPQQKITRAETAKVMVESLKK